MQKQINARVSHKHDMEANWLKTPTFVPKAGELIVYDKDDTHTFARAKIGDGTTAVGSLPFLHEFVTGTASQYLSFDANGKMTAKALATSVSESNTTAVTSGAVYEHVEDQAHNVADAMRTMMNGGVSWNGSFDGRTTVGINEATSGTFTGYVHVSDDLPPADLFPGSYCSIAMAIYDGEESSQAKYQYSAVTHMPDTINTLFKKIDDYSHRLSIYIVFITEDNYTSEGLTFPKKGTYFLATGEYLSDGTKVAKEYICGFSMTNYYYPHPSLSAYMESDGAFLGDTITWDGNTDGYTVYDDELVHMTTNVPDPTLFVGDNIIEVTTISNGVATVSTPRCSFTEVSTGLYYLFYETNSGSLEVAGVIVPQPLAYEDGTTLQGLIFFIDGNTSDDNVRSYISKLRIPGFNFISANGAGGGDVFKREYLPAALRFGEYVEAEYSNSLTWDGTVGNRDTISLSDTTLVRIGDATMTCAQVISGDLTVSVVENGSTTSGLIIEGSEMVEGEIAMIGVDSMTFGFYVAQDNYSLDGVYFKKKGFYLINQGFYISEITTDVADNLFITRDAGFTKISEQYLPAIADNEARASVSLLTDRMDSAESNISSLSSKMTAAEKNITSLTTEMGSKITQDEAVTLSQQFANLALQESNTYTDTSIAEKHKVYGKAVFFGDSLCSGFGNLVKDNNGETVYLAFDKDGNKVYFVHRTDITESFYVVDENGSNLVHKVTQYTDNNSIFYVTASNGNIVFYQIGSDGEIAWLPTYYYNETSQTPVKTGRIITAPHGCVEYLRDFGIFEKVTNYAIPGTTLGPYGSTYDADLCFLNIFDRCSNSIAEADYVFIELLGHDIGCYMRGEVEIGTPEDPDTATTICGCIKKAINRIRAINPDVKIIWVPDGKISYYIDDPSSHYHGGHDGYDARIVAEASAYRTIEQMNVQIICISEGFDFLNCEDLLQYGNHPGPIGHMRVANVIRDNINANNEVPYLGRTYHISINNDSTFSIDGQYKYCYDMLKLGGVDVKLQFINIGIGANMYFRPMWYTPEYISFVSYVVIGSWLNVVTAVWAADGTITLSYEQVNNDHEYTATDTGTTDENGNAIMSISGGTWEEALNYIQSANATVRIRSTNAEMGVAIFTPQVYYGDDIYFSTHTVFNNAYVTLMLIWNKNGTATMKYFMG